jgi:hypothetical protein
LKKAARTKLGITMIETINKMSSKMKSSSQAKLVDIESACA